MADTLDGVNAELAQHVRFIQSAAAKRGVTVTVDSGQRSEEEQFSLRGANGCRGREYDRSCKGNPTTAIPSEDAPHVRGAAVDLADGTSDRRHIMAIIREHNLPLIRPLYPPLSTDNESWHFELSSRAGAGDSGGGAALPKGIPGASVLTDPQTWFRVALVVLGLAGVVGGLLILGGAMTIEELV